MTDPVEIHNRLAPVLAAAVINATDDSGDAMIMLESIIYGVVSYYWPNVAQAPVILEELTAQVIERYKSK